MTKLARSLAWLDDVLNPLLVREVRRTFRGRLFTLGFLATLGAVAVLLGAQGTLAEAFYWTIVDHDVPQIFWQRAVLHTAAFVVSCLPLLLAALTAERRPPIWKFREEPPRPSPLPCTPLMSRSSIQWWWKSWSG